MDKNYYIIPVFIMYNICCDGKRDCSMLAKDNCTNGFCHLWIALFGQNKSVLESKLSENKGVDKKT